MKRKLLAITLCTLICLGLAACSGSSSTAASKTASSSAASSTSSSAASSSASSSASGDFKALTAGMFDSTSVCLTSAGQSADLNVVQTLLKKAGIDAYMNATMDAATLKQYKTLVVAIGGSSKGLGAAGIDENQELQRLNTLYAEAKADGIKVLSLHIGGSSRRGVLSDKFIPDALKASTAAIILKEGDSDSMMKNILVSGSIPAQYVEKQVDAVEPLKLVFGK